MCTCGSTAQINEIAMTDRKMRDPVTENRRLSRTRDGKRSAGGSRLAGHSPGAV